MRGRISDLVDYRELLLNLTQRDLLLKYKGSFLGVAWSLLNPLLQMAIYTLVFNIYLRVVTLPHYWAFIVGGIVFWTFFSTSLTNASIAFVRNPGLLTRVYFPIEVLPLSGIFANFVNLLIPLCIMLVVFPFAGVHLGASLVLLPVILLCTLATAIGLGLLVACLTVYLRDVEHFLILGIQIFFYGSPILYPLVPGLTPTAAAKFLPILKANPLAWYLDSFHNVMYFGTFPGWKQFAAMMVFSVFCLVLGYGVFHRLRPSIPENV